MASFGNFLFFGRLQLLQGAHQDEIGMSALKDLVEALLVTVNEVEVRLRGSDCEGIGETGRLVGIGGPGGNRVIRDTGLDCPQAALAPNGGEHLLDHAELDAVGGTEALDEVGEEGIEILARFALQEKALGQQAAADGIPRRTALFGRSDRPPGAGSIGSRRDLAY
jgi:hypothetical protein